MKKVILILQHVNFCFQNTRQSKENKKRGDLPPEEGKNRKPEREDRKSRSEKKEERIGSFALCFFPFAGNGGSHSQHRREGKKKAGQIRPFLGIVSGGA
jgi:hypothetical protein